jgi:hypothetical protein
MGLWRRDFIEIVDEEPVEPPFEFAADEPQAPEVGQSGQPCWHGPEEGLREGTSAEPAADLERRQSHPARERLIVLAALIAAGTGIASTLRPFPQAPQATSISDGAVQSEPVRIPGRDRDASRVPAPRKQVKRRRAPEKRTAPEPRAVEVPTQAVPTPAPQAAAPAYEPPAVPAAGATTRADAPPSNFDPAEREFGFER